MPPTVVVMGVSGAGKSAVGRRLASALGTRFADGDDYHPAANVAKMAAGQPLDDDDRAPWLARLREVIEDGLRSGDGVVVACSALKERYRDALSGGDPRVRFVYLEGDAATIARRMRRRRGHYMKVDLLPSQLEALEPPTDAIALDIREPLPAVVRHALEALAERGSEEATAALGRTPSREEEDPT